MEKKSSSEELVGVREAFGCGEKEEGAVKFHE